ncbi:MAG TPA: DUF177 domain-containing protein [Bacteroidales bacterium]|nr:DUF177 domain-containing protein [Bacteroidales bacterium]
MKYEREFILPLTGATLGPKLFSFDLGEEFLAFSQFPEAANGSVRLELLLDKHPAFIALQFDFTGWLQLICDRCADEYKQFVEGSFRYILKYGDHMEEESDEVMLIPADLHEFDVFQLIYEFMMLLVPLRKVHPDDERGNSTCNPEAIALLEQMKPAADTDPRWSTLQSLLKSSGEQQS